MRIRPRSESDIPQLVSMADEVRAIDRWPPHRVGTTRDLIAGGSPLAGLVAEDHGELAGHVIVQEESASSVMVFAADMTGVPADNLASVARLFVAPNSRGLGIGMKLLEAAAEAAITAGKHPILDVWTELDHAIALYERSGWRRLGEVTFTFKKPCSPDCLHTEGSLTSFVYSSPIS